MKIKGIKNNITGDWIKNIITLRIMLKLKKIFHFYAEG
jgi:hypothetical protein